MAADDSKPEPSARAKAFSAWMEAQGLNVSRVAKRAQVPYTTVASFNVGDTQSLKGTTEAKIAKAFEATVEAIFGQVGGVAETASPFVGMGEIMLPVRYEVAAGAWKARDQVAQEPEEPEMYPAVLDPRYVGIPQWLERVLGDSYNKRAPEGALVHVVDAIAIEYEPHHKDTVIVVRTEAEGAFSERTLKQVWITRGEIQLRPRSHNKNWSEPINFSKGMGDPDFNEVRIVGLVLKAYVGFDEADDEQG